MSHLKKAGCMVLGLAVAVLVGWPVWHVYSWRADYNEAEPLLQILVPVGNAMREFEKNKGRGPATLAELEAFDTTVDVAALSPYDVTLDPTGNPRLFLRVNRRFHFTISDQYHPIFEWTEAEDPAGE